MNLGKSITSGLEKRPHLTTVVAIAAAFLTYYCMYAFRKPFSVITAEDGQEVWGVGLKTSLVVAQLLGYTLSKFLGTRLCSGVHRENVFLWLMGCILTALAPLAILPLLPDEWKFVSLALNGLSLGLVWGIVVRPLEGRGNSELLVAGLSCSFILASGDVKSAGKSILQADWFQAWFGGEQFWMPFMTGAIYLVPFVIAAWVLSLIPQPSSKDEKLRKVRHAMRPGDRMAFVKGFLPLLLPLMIMFLIVTAFRDYRDNFQADLLEELGYEGEASIFSEIERVVTVVMLVLVALMIFVKHNLIALRICITTMMLGVFTCLVAAVMRQSGSIDSTTWMTLLGIGIYAAYIPVNCILFERLVAISKTQANAVFAIMLFDGLGYLGAVAITLCNDLMEFPSKVDFVDRFSWFTAIVAGGCLVYTQFILRREYRKAQGANLSNPEATCASATS
jgi:hypothetical protein